MKDLLFSALFSLLCTASIAQKNSSAESINTFSFKLFEQVYSGQQNCFYSPYSIFGALAMTYTGAEKVTKQEMEKALETDNGEIVPENFLNLTKSLQLNSDFKLLTANSIWLHKTFKLKKSFSKITNEFYNAKSKNVDFVDESNREKARNEINEWVEKQTNQQIKNFIKPGLLTESTGMVLVNAVYFKALWEKDFLSKETSAEKFLAASGDSVNCKMMNTPLNTNYYEDEIVQAIEIPYENKGASMLIILPKKSTKANTNVIDYKYYTEISKSLDVKNVKLSIPKFRMDVNYELSKVLKQLGMKSAFARDADFSGITGGRDLILSNVLHQSIIEVSEKGTEASSSTAVISMRSTMVAKDIPVIFKANRPFLFVIKENTNNVILFMGRLAEPPGITNNAKKPQVQSRE